jgi:hypothetical protein
VDDLDQFASEIQFVGDSNVIFSKNFKLAQSLEPPKYRSTEFMLSKTDYNRTSAMKSSRDLTTGRLSKRRSHYVKLLKKINPFIKDTLEIWRELKIGDIISESKLNRMGENDIVYCGDLYKYIQDESNMNRAYSPTFAIFTKCELRYRLIILASIKQEKPFYEN